MKALEILKAFADRHESAYGFNNIIVASLGDITEALEELSSLEQHITELEVQLADANSYFDGIHTELLANKIKES